MSRKPVHQADSVRIIGGQWRSRKISFTAVEDLRPTPDRVRETLFNWLQDVVVGANCLDLFAGSGALGIEALSRGASHCLFMDSHDQCIKEIQANLQHLNAEGGETRLGDTLQLLTNSSQDQTRRKYNVVMIDPPYAMECAIKCCNLLVEHGWLADEAYVYIESAKPISESELPKNWQLHRQKKAGNVNYHLAIQKI